MNHQRRYSSVALLLILLQLVGIDSTIHLCAALVPSNYTQLTVPVDHFNSSDTRSFNLQLQWSTHFWQPNGPLLVLIGPERQLTPNEIAITSVYSTFAASLGGAVLCTEHRYYGTSLPFGSNSFTLEALQYLTIEQTLADNQQAIEWMIQEVMQGSTTGPVHVLTFGGSYGGYLSALMRITYPSLVTGALASCTVPYLWSNDFPQSTLWYDMVSETFEESYLPGGCGDGVGAAFKQLYVDFEAGNYTAIQNGLGLCTAPGPNDLGVLFEFVKRFYSDVTLFNYPNVDIFCEGNPFQYYCDYVTQAGPEPYQVIQFALQMMYNASGTVPGTCINWTGSQTILPSSFCTHPHSKSMSKSVTIPAHTPSTSPPSFASLAIDPTAGPIDPWAWQSCTQFIYGGGGGTGIFGWGWEWSMAISQGACSWTGAAFQPFAPLLDPSSSTANFTNVIFSRAEYDPNRGWVPNFNISDTVIVFNLVNVSHTADVINFGPLTPPALIDAMAMEINALRNFIYAAIKEEQTEQPSETISEY